MYFATANPVVVTESCGEKTFFEGKREKLKITDEDVTTFIERWVTLRYSWSEFNAEKIIKAIAPLTTDGLQERLKDLLGKKAPANAKAGTTTQATPALKDQQIAEHVAELQVTLSDHEAVAAFDRIVRINGIPVILPSQVSLQIIQGPVTRWNRLGLYVNGVIEHDEK